MCIPMPFGLKRVCVSAATMPPVRGRAGGEVGGADAMLDSLSDGGEGAMSHRRILPRSCTQASTALLSQESSPWRRFWHGL